jgi:hypothetical protein
MLNRLEDAFKEMAPLVPAPAIARSLVAEV